MDAARVEILRDVLSSTGWVERTRDFARALRRGTRREGGLLLVGTPQEEPWHLAAHLDDESRSAGIPEIRPTLVRWRAPVGAPPHLRATLQRLEKAGRGETVFVVSPGVPPVPLLERVSGARRAGATVLVIDHGDDELDELAHEFISVPSNGLLLPYTPDLSGADISFDTVSFDTVSFDTVSFDTVSFDTVSFDTVSLDTVQHLVSSAVCEPFDDRHRGWRDRLAALIDVVSGPAPER